MHWDKNSAWLYFGCRDENENLFEEETAKSVQRIVAFSRKNNSKIYVQDLVVNDGELIYDLIMNRKAHFYICGKVCNYLLNFLHIPHAICTRNVSHCLKINQNIIFEVFDLGIFHQFKFFRNGPLEAFLMNFSPLKTQLCPQC